MSQVEGELLQASDRTGKLCNCIKDKLCVRPVCNNLKVELYSVIYRFHPSLGTRLAEPLMWFSNLDAVFMEICILPCYQA